MNVTLRQLQVFAKVAETGSFTRASEQLFLTQPAVSQQIRLLTESIGEPLLEIMGRKIHLTRAGQELLRTAQAMSLQWQQFEEEICAERGLQHGSLKLAVVSTAKYFFPRVLGQFCQRYPGIDVRLEVVNRDRIIERIAANLDDLYVMSKPPENFDLVQEPFLSNPLVPIAAINHPLASASSLTLSDLCQERFIMREQGSGTRIAIEQYLMEQGQSLNVRMELGSNEAIKQVVAGGLGLSILSRHTLHRIRAEEDEVTILPVQGFPLQSQWQLVYLQQKKLSRASLAFLDELKLWLPGYLAT